MQIFGRHSSNYSLDHKMIRSSRSLTSVRVFDLEYEFWVSLSMQHFLILFVVVCFVLHFLQESVIHELLANFEFVKLFLREKKTHELLANFCYVKSFSLKSSTNKLGERGINFWKIFQVSSVMGYNFKASMSGKRLPVS